jgi:hypothetical protein
LNAQRNIVGAQKTATFIYFSATFSMEEKKLLRDLKKPLKS